MASFPPASFLSDPRLPPVTATRESPNVTATRASPNVTATRASPNATASRGCGVAAQAPP